MAPIHEWRSFTAPPTHQRLGPFLLWPNISTMIKDFLQRRLEECTLACILIFVYHMREQCLGCVESVNAHLTSVLSYYIHHITLHILIVCHIVWESTLVWKHSAPPTHKQGESLFDDWQRLLMSRLQFRWCFQRKASVIVNTTGYYC